MVGEGLFYLHCWYDYDKIRPFKKQGCETFTLQPTLPPLVATLQKLPLVQLFVNLESAHNLGNGSSQRDGIETLAPEIRPSLLVAQCQGHDGAYFGGRVADCTPTVQSLGGDPAAQKEVSARG